MGIRNSRPRNWGQEAQQSALLMLMLQRSVAYRLCRVPRQRKRFELALAASRDGMTLPFETVATVENVARGRWEARHIEDDRLLAQGISERDIIRATIQNVWH